MGQPRQASPSVTTGGPSWATINVDAVDADGRVVAILHGRVTTIATAVHLSTPWPGQRALVAIGPDVEPLIVAVYPQATSSVDQPTDDRRAGVQYDAATGTLNVQARQLNLQAVSAIEIRCGEAVLRFNAQGEVFMQAEAITQAAIGPYQIEGASIDLN